MGFLKPAHAWSRMPALAPMRSCMQARVPMRSFAQVLSVDDEPINQQVMHSLLWAQDYELVAVVSREG